MINKIFPKKILGASARVSTPTRIKKMAPANPKKIQIPLRMVNFSPISMAESTSTRIGVMVDKIEL